MSVPRQGGRVLVVLSYLLRASGGTSLLPPEEFVNKDYDKCIDRGPNVIPRTTVDLSRLFQPWYHSTVFPLG